MSAGWAIRTAIKPQLNVGEQLEFFAQLYGARGAIRAGAGAGRACPPARTALPLSLRGPEEASGPGAADALEPPPVAAGRAFRRAGHRRPRIWPANLMAAHCAAGGIVVAATHDAAGPRRAVAAPGGGMSGPSPACWSAICGWRRAPAAAPPWRWPSSPWWRPWCRWAWARICSLLAGSRAASCGWARCWRRCCRWTGCFRAISRTAAWI